MNSLFLSAVFILVILSTASAFYLLKKLKKDKQIPALVGLFCIAMGFLLLLLDMLLIAFTHGPQHIPDYLLFNRLVSDTGFSGRWVLTVYLFILTGVGISFYLLATNMIKKLNSRRGKGKI